MQIHKTTKGFELTGAIEKYLDKKLNVIKKLIDYAPGKHETWIELAKTTQHHNKGNYFESKIDIALKNRTIHAQERGESLYEAIDKMEARVIRELKHYKDKFSAKERRQARKWKALTHFSSAVFSRKKGGRNRDEGM